MGGMSRSSSTITTQEVFVEDNELASWRENVWRVPDEKQESHVRLWQRLTLPHNAHVVEWQRWQARPWTWRNHAARWLNGFLNWLEGEG